MEEILLTPEQAVVGTVIDTRDGALIKVTEIHEDGSTQTETETHPSLKTAVRLLGQVQGTPLALMLFLRFLLYLCAELPKMQLNQLDSILWQVLPYHCKLVAWHSQSGQPFTEAVFPTPLVLQGTVEEETVVERDENGLIQGARKVKRGV